MQIPNHPTWQILDSSKLSEFNDCPRKYFYRYILGWVLDSPAHDLYFGEAWHLAREYQLINGYDDVKGAYTKFIEFYRKKFPESTDEIYKPKDPMAVAFALSKFAYDRKSDLVENELLYSEVSGKVPISEDRFLHYRMDSVLRRKSDNRIFSWDHKSATERSMNYPWWADNFLLGMQAGTYTHCLYCMYPIEQVIGIEFCGTSFHYLNRGSSTRPKGYQISFKRVPVWKTPDQMNTWLWTANDTYSKIMYEMERLDKYTDSDAVLMAFPINPGSCSKYLGCKYHDFCISWANPLQSCYEPPIGFRQEYWNPSEIETTNKKDLEWK